MLLFRILAVACVWAAIPFAQPIAPAATPGLAPLRPAEKYEWQLKRAFRPVRWAGWAAGAGIAQWRDIPEEWEQGMSGLGKRYAAALAFTGTRNAMIATGNVLLQVEPRYQRSLSASPKARVGHAVKWTFLSHRDDGRALPALPRFASAYGAAFTARAWLPPSRGGVDQALTRGSVIIGLDVVNNLLAEFGPDLFRKLRKKKLDTD